MVVTLTNGFDLMKEVFNNTSFFGSTILMSAIITIVTLAIITRKYSDWGKLAFPIATGWNVSGLFNVHYTIMAITGVLFVITTLTPNTIGKTLSRMNSFVNDMQNQKSIQADKYVSKIKNIEKMNKSIAIADLTEKREFTVKGSKERKTLDKQLNEMKLTDKEKTILKVQDRADKRQKAFLSGQKELITLKEKSSKQMTKEYEKSQRKLLKEKENMNKAVQLGIMSSLEAKEKQKQIDQIRFNESQNEIARRKEIESQRFKENQLETERRKQGGFWKNMNIMTNNQLETASIKQEAFQTQQDPLVIAEMRRIAKLHKKKKVTGW